MDKLFTRLDSLPSNLQLSVLRQTLSNLHDSAARNGAVDAADIEFFLGSQINDWTPARPPAEEQGGEEG